MENYVIFNFHTKEYLTHPNNEKRWSKKRDEAWVLYEDIALELRNGLDKDGVKLMVVRV